MKYIIIFLCSIVITSCGVMRATSDDLTQINNRLTLKEAKTIFEDIHKEEDIITKKVGSDYYTVLVMRKITVTEKEAYTATSTNQSMGNNSMGHPTTTQTQVSETRSRFNSTFTKFYIVFKGEDYVFSGYGYEAKISPKSDLLTSLIDFSIMEDEK